MNPPNALPGAHAPRLVPLLNPIVRWLMRAGLPFGPNVLLTVRGRSSGLPRTFPVALMETRGRRFVQSPYGAVNWVRNLRADGDAALVRAGVEEPVRAVELVPEEAGPILRDALAPYHRGRLRAAFAYRFVAIRADADEAAYVDHVRRHPMFELRPLIRDDGATADRPPTPART